MVELPPNMLGNVNPLKGDRHMRGLFKLEGYGSAVSVCLLSLLSTPALAYFDTGNQVYERCIGPRQYI
jgi:hypothetical protein